MGIAAISGRPSALLHDDWGDRVARIDGTEQLHRHEQLQEHRSTVRGLASMGRPRRPPVLRTDTSTYDPLLDDACDHCLDSFRGHGHRPRAVRQLVTVPVTMLSAGTSLASASNSCVQNGAVMLTKDHKAECEALACIVSPARPRHEPAKTPPAGCARPPGWQQVAAFNAGIRGDQGGGAVEYL
jgi:hypothetical protein